jgi:tetratricopeptide (TPR) repeat protein
MEPATPSVPPRLVVRRLSKGALLLHLGALAAMVALASRLFPEYGFLDALLVGAAPYACYSAVARPLLTRHHRAGIRLLRAGRFEEAVRAFEESRDFFTRHPALDRFRFPILMSAGAATYRELAMGNIAYAHARAGDFDAARRACLEALADYPESAVARPILDTLPPGDGGAATSGGGAPGR